MAELGSGAGSSYPAILDVDASKEVDNVTTARANVPNDSNDAVIQIQGTLGTNPQGNKTTVKERLSVLMDNDGVAKNILEGTFANRPGSPAFPMFYFATDMEQMWFYSPTKTTWYPAF